MGILYKEIAEKIKEYISSMPFGSSKLPSERNLCEMMGVSRQTIRHALDECEQQGLIERRMGSGIFLSASYQKSRNKIALLIPNREEYIYPSLIFELETKYSECLYSMYIYETKDDPCTINQLLLSFLSNPVKSILMVPVRNALPTPCDNLFNKLKAIGTEIVFIGNPYPNLSNYSYLKNDNYFAGYSIASKLTALDKPWCAFFMHDNQSSYDKYLGMTQSMNELNFNYSPDNIKWFSYEEYQNMEYSNSYNFLTDFIKTRAVVPSAFVCDNDAVAYWLLKVLKNVSIQTDDITVFSFDKSYITTLVEPRLFSFGSDISVLAATAVRLSISNTKKEKEVITLPSSL